MERRRFLVKAGGVLAVSGAAAVVDAPYVIAQPKFQWRMPTTWTPALDVMQGSAQQVAKVVEEMTGGRLRIEVFPAGQVARFLVAVIAVAVVAVLTVFDPAAATELIFDTQEFAPYNYSEGGEVKGPVAEIIRKVCAEMRIDCPMRSLPWGRAQQELAEGKAHGIFSIGWNAERAKWLHFSPPILTSEYGFFVRNENPLVFKQNTDVKGYTVGVYGPSNTATALDKIKAEIKDLTIDMTPRDEAAFKKLSLGRVQAVFSNRDVGYDLIRRLNIGNVRYAGRQQSLKYHVGFSQKYTDKALVDRFNDTLRTLHKQGVIQEILARYKMDAAPLE